MIYRLEKGEPLSAYELDENFRTLHERVQELEENTPRPEGIGEIRQEGRMLIIKSVLGQELGQVELPVYQPVFKGVWQENTHYKQGEWCYRDGGLLMAREDHVASDFQEGRWQVIFEVPATKHRLPVYPEESLPKGQVGEMILVMKDRGLEPHFFDGCTWKAMGGKVDGIE